MTTGEERPIAFAVARSGNTKIGECATTYAAQQSCPESCVFKDGGGCYAESGFLAIHSTRPLNESARLASPLDVAEAEAAAIRSMEAIEGRPLRLHTVGDCASTRAAAVVSDACSDYMRRGGGPVWTYTHAWRDVPRDAWGCVSVLASCETAADVAEARERGYAPSIVVDEFADDKLYTDSEGQPSVSILPCPAQSRHGAVTCASCRLCMDDQRLLASGYAIGFEVHGTALSVKKARASLERPHDESRKLTSRDHAIRYRDEHGDWPSAGALARLASVTRGSAAEMLTRLAAA